jgi:hypothetical protein
MIWGRISLPGKFIVADGFGIGVGDAISLAVSVSADRDPDLIATVVNMIATMVNMITAKNTQRGVLEFCAGGVMGCDGSQRAPHFRQNWALRLICAPQLGQYLVCM